MRNFIKRRVKFAAGSCLSWRHAMGSESDLNLVGKVLLFPFYIYFTVWSFLFALLLEKDGR